MNFVSTSLPSQPTVYIHQTDQLRQAHYSKNLLIQIAIGILSVFLYTLLIITLTYMITKKKQCSLTYINNSTQTTLNSLSTTDLPVSTSSDNLRIKAGVKFGGPEGSAFDDSLMENFASSYSLHEILLQREDACVNWFQCFYSSNNASKEILQGPTHGIRETTDVGDRFSLENDEKISKVQVKVDKVQLYQDGVPTMIPKLIIAIRFFTTKSRSTPDINHVKGENFTEEYPGYTVGYVAGRAGRYINQIQFYWYQTTDN